MNTEGRHDSRYPLLSRLFQFMKRVPWWCLLTIAVVTAIFFWRILFLGEHIAFRDGAHFYPPLFEYIQSEWRAGRVPLWNPYENLGQPLLANPVSSVFYPGKLIYFLPITAYHAYHLYVIGHFLLAAMTCYRLTRHFRGSRPAAMIATLSYVFGGSVLFQYSNVVFLVGAAWLPEAIRQADILITTRRISAMVALGLVFAMFVLGGDPQMAYHAFVLILLLLFFYRRNGKKPLTDSRLSIETNSVLHLFETNSSTASGNFVTNGGGRFSGPRPILLLGCSLLIGALLAAVQWLPALELGINGDRNLEDKPASLWKSLIVLERGYREHEKHEAWDRVKDGLAADETQQSGMAKARYNFSVGPWRLIEYVWPNANGRMFPVNTNWGTAIAKKWPCSGIWSPSLYMGIIPFLLAIVALRFRKTSPLTLWLSWSFLIFLLGSLGYFGLGWVVNQTISLVTGNGGATGLGSPFGGIYWLFSLVLPGYDQFRYPAKLLTVSALMLSLLSARSFDAMFGLPDLCEPMHLTDMRQKQRKYRKSLLGLSRLLIIFSFLLIPVVLVSRFWVLLAKQVPDDPVFGRFVVDRAIGEAAFSLVHVLNILFLFFVIVRIFSRQLLLLERSDNPLPLQEQSKRHRQYFGRLGLAVVLLVGCDLAASNLWMIGTAQRHFFEGKPLLATFLDVQTHPLQEQPGHAADSAVFPVRTWRAPTYLGGVAQTEDEPRNWLPKEFQFPSSNRLAEWVIWERSSLSPRYPLSQHIAVTDVRGTIVTADYYAVSQILRDAWQRPGNGHRNDRFSLPEYLGTLGNSSMIVPALRDKEIFVSENQLRDPIMADPIELLDQATREEAESYRNQIPVDGNENEAGENGQLFQWGRNQKSITQLLPAEVRYWPLNAAPHITVVDRFRLEQPLDFTSREKFFAKSRQILVQGQQTGVPVVEWGKEHFDHLPARFTRSFMKLAAMGEFPHRNSPPDFDERRPVGEAELVSYEPQKVVIRTRIHRPGLLILSEQYDANWRAEVRHIPEGTWHPAVGKSESSRPFPPAGPPGPHDPPHGFPPPFGMPPHPGEPPTLGELPPGDHSPAYHVPVLRTNRVLRGVPLPEGEWEVTFVYNPLSFRLGATLSFFAWVSLAMFLLGFMARKIKQRKKI